MLCGALSVIACVEGDGRQGKGRSSYGAMCVWAGDCVWVDRACQHMGWTGFGDVYLLGGAAK